MARARLEFLVETMVFNIEFQVFKNLYLSKYGVKMSYYSILILVL